MKRILPIVFLALTCAAGLAWGAKQPQAPSGNRLQIVFSGIQDETVLENVKTILEIADEKVEASPTRLNLRKLFEEGPNLIKRALAPYGYYQATVESHREQKGTQWVFHYKVDTGPKTHINKVNIQLLGEGTHDAIFKNYLNKKPLKVGAPLNTEAYEDVKTQLHDIALEHGYFDAKMIRSRIRVNLHTHKAHILIRFHTGKRYYFGATLIKYTGMLNHNFIRRFLKYKKGDFYLSKKVHQTRTDLSASNYFGEVNVRPRVKEAKNTTVPIHITLKDGPNHFYRAGGGFGTDTGPRATLGYTLRRINASGHSFESLSRVSFKTQEVTASYVVPGEEPAIENEKLTANLGRLKQTTGESVWRKLSAIETRNWGNFTQIISLNLHSESYKINSIPKKKVLMFYPAVNWEYVSTEDRLHPPQGYKISVILAGTPNQLSNKGGFFQSRLDTKWITSFWDEETRIILRGSIANTVIDEINDLPLSLQLFVGGARSLRGFKLNEIGPGKNKFEASAELQQRIKGDFYLAGFFDAGNATNRGFIKNYKRAAGAGVAWLSPLGIIEAFVSRQIGVIKPKWRFQFLMGPEL